jgi:hypothetical protein
MFCIVFYIAGNSYGDTISTNKPGMVVPVSVILAMGEVEAGGLLFEAGLGKSARPYLQSKLQSTLCMCKYIIPKRLLLRKTHECSGCTEFSALKINDLPLPICTVGSGIHNLKPYGRGHNTAPN